MKRVRLFDTVDVISEREDCPSRSPFDRFVGLEHYDTGEVKIQHWGEPGKLSSAMKIFRPRDVLVARRNVYLRRAAMVDFAGITSGDSIVLRAKNASFARILPFVLNTDAFWDYADRHADGTMSKRLSPITMADFEFSIPDDNTIESLADILWGFHRTRTAYRELIDATDNLVKSQFVEMFGDPTENPMGFEKKAFSETCTIITGNTPSRSVKEYYGDFIEWIKSDNITNESQYLSKAAESLSEEGARIGRIVHDGAVLMTCIAGSLNTVGNVAIVDRDISFNQQLNAFVPHEYETLFLYYLLKLLKTKLHEFASNSLKCILNKGNLESFSAIVPDLARQKTFAAFVAQSTKCKYPAHSSHEFSV